VSMNHICEKYSSAIQTMEDIKKRCALYEEIDDALELIESEDWKSVFKCKTCGNFWAREFPFGEQHGGGTPCFYLLEKIVPKDWIKGDNKITYEIRQKFEDKEFFDELPDETDESCDKEDCTRNRIKNSVLCKQHHYESIKGKVCPF